MQVKRHLSEIRIQLILSSFLIAFLLLWEPPAGFAHEFSRETAVVKAVRKTSPAVVNISSAVQVRKRTSPFSGFGFNPFFEEFFKDFFDPRFERRRKYTSLGSGVIIDGKKGLILTNAHVIQKTGTIKVVLEDEREFEAKIVGADPDSDLAVLKIDFEQYLPAIKMGSSDDLMIGETVIAIGNPFGFSHTVTTGVISALNRSIRAEDRVYHDFIQIDASINPGNSGGPLLNINGDLIGINSRNLGGVTGAQNIGFATPITMARDVMNQIIEYGSVSRGWLGAYFGNLRPTSLPDGTIARRGISVRDVTKGGPAWNAGIRQGDLIFKLDGEPVDDTNLFLLQISQREPGTQIELEVIRRKETFQTYATLIQQPPIQ